MQTLGPTSPITPVLLQGIIQSSSISNREEIIATLQKMSQPDPAQAQLQQQSGALDLAIKQATLELTQANAAKAKADASKTIVEAQIMPQEAEAKMIGNISRGSKDKNDFDQRVKVAELALKEQDIVSNERIAMTQMAHKANSKQK
jgi:LytS/YehU family sensor histidine kinase